ncbi:MAG: hypothetical protein HOP12_10155 [Candidatus Eisenbacteria bacterium]|uniref:Soluble ligand binding domain-containing protein n=1 Tax=Eiseniibacteriota bacterium TaxID=2212470 RepID=A0A849SZK5_UNCEI|nr:hypothetical protein [Candidatus Eisenbacteria bacterium]
MSRADVRIARVALLWVVVAALFAIPARAQGEGGSMGGFGSGSAPGSDPGSTPSTSGFDRSSTFRTGPPGLTEDLARGMLPVPNAALGLAGSIDAELYRVGPGDVLQLLMWGKVSRSLVLDVGPEGQVLLPGIGTLDVDGRTLANVREDVFRRMRREFRDVQMDLRLVQPRSFRVYLSGRVRVPGPLVTLATSRVADVLTAGQLADDGSRRRIEVRHRDGTREEADLELFNRLGLNTRNPYLRDGDILQVPVATDFVYAAGAFARPGRIELGAIDSLLTLFKLAGDPLPAADAERALLIRFSKPFQPESLWFGLDDVYSNRQNPPLQEGDRLFVYYIPQYHLQHQIEVVGEVARPGVYPIVEGRHRLSDLVAAAGGFLPVANLSAIRVQRRNTGTGAPDPELDRLLRLSRNDLTNTEYEVLRTRLASLKEEFRVDWARLQSNRTQLDLLLRDGDVVRVERLVSSIRVDGEVRRPGIVEFSRGRRAEDYVSEAGGFTDRAWRSRVRVTRSVTGQTLLAKNVSALDPGDIIWVPERPDVSAWQQFQTFLMVAAQVATLLIAVDAVRN